jgi:hypothetical protein
MVVGKVIKYLVLLLMVVIEIIFKGTVTSVKRGDYRSIYYSYGLFFMLLSVYLYRYNSGIANILRLFIALILVALLTFIFISIKRSNMESEELFLQSMGWWLASTCYLYIITILVLNFTKITINVIAVTFFVFIYYGMRYVLYRWIRHWGTYSLVFLLMPIISLFLWSFFGMLLRDLTNNPVFISDSTLGWMVLFISILLTNFSVKWTPFQRIDEVKVAMYFLLAVFSTISYCFFISDYLAAILGPYIGKILGLLVTDQEIKDGIKNIITWGSLPYLIGSVFGCFTIELVSRNHSKNAGSNI